MEEFNEPDVCERSEDDVKSTLDNLKRENMSYDSLMNNSFFNWIFFEKENEVLDLSNSNDDILTSIARSAYADMLWDQERNYAYKKAVKKVLNELLACKMNQKVNLLDIGSGTGLLSMFMCRTLNEFFYNHPNFDKKNKKITALEQFHYSYLSCKEIIHLNKMNDQINLIYNNSMSEKFNQTEKCDFLVTELFDTELIGESALEIFRDAKKKLLNNDASIVPKRAHIYCQLIESKFLTNGNQFNPVRIKGCSNTILINHCDEINDCPGSCAELNDMQLNSLCINDFRLVSDVKIAFVIEFDNPPGNSSDSSTIRFKIMKKPKKFSHVCVAVWWDLDMDNEGEIVLSCAPFWARNDIYYEKVFADQLVHDCSVLFKSEVKLKGLRNVEKELQDLKDGCFAYYFQVLNASGGHFPYIIEQNFDKLKLSCQWRDHWMQSVYFFPNSVFRNPLIENDMIEIQMHRDDYRFWFYHCNSHKIQEINKMHSELNIQPNCICGYHRIYSRNQIRQINDHQLINQITMSFKEVLKEYKTINSMSSNKVNLDNSNLISNNSTLCEEIESKLSSEDNLNVMCHGGLGIFSLIIIKLVPQSKIFIHNLNKTCPFYKEIIFKEGLENNFFSASNLLNFAVKIDILVKDPCIDLNKLPWLDVHEFLFVYRSLLFNQIPLVLPNKINFKIIPICFDHLWKIRFVIKKIDGLDLLPFNKMVSNALDKENRQIEMYSLQEYDGVALALPQLLLTITVANMNCYKGETSLTFDFNCEKIRQQLRDLYGVNEEEKSRSIFDQQLDKVLPFRRSLTNITFVIWSEYNRLVNTGLSSVKLDFSSKINWNKLYKQAVYFTPDLNRDFLDTAKHLKINLHLTYDFSNLTNIFQLSHNHQLFD